jgi:hypothetical protein
MGQDETRSASLFRQCTIDFFERSFCTDSTSIWWTEPITLVVTREPWNLGWRAGINLNLISKFGTVLCWKINAGNDEVSMLLKRKLKISNLAVYSSYRYWKYKKYNSVLTAVSDRERIFASTKTWSHGWTDRQTDRQADMSSTIVHLFHEWENALKRLLDSCVPEKLRLKMSLSRLFIYWCTNFYF